MKHGQFKGYLSNALGQTTQFEYTEQGQLTKVVDPLNRTVVEAEYGWNGPNWVKDAAGRTTTLSYNTFGDLTGVTTPDGLTSMTLVNGLGLPTSTIDPEGRVTSFTYDALSRVTHITDPQGAQTRFWYDANDNLTKVRDALGRESTMTYDSLDQLLSTTNPRSDTETYEYTPVGELKAVTNGRGFKRHYQYTARGELKYMWMPDGTNEFYDYFGDGSLSHFRGSGRNTIGYEYDPVGRMTKVDYATMTDTVFTYDTAGRRISMLDGTGLTSWFYDAAGQLTTLNQAGKVTSYTYNPDGSRATMVQPAGTTSYNYDTLGRLLSLVNPHGETTSFTYDNFSRLTSKLLSSGLKEEYSYDTLDRLQQMLTRNTAGSVTHSESYAYNTVSEVLSHTTNGETVSYSYDPASQLIAETRPGYSASYSYDANGNRLSRTVNGNTTNYSYDAGDKMLTAGSNSFVYDGAGRRIQKKLGSYIQQSYVYDDESRLLSTGQQTFTYNGLDTRTKMISTGSTTEFHRDGTGVTAPVISEHQGGLERTLTPGISRRDGTTTTFFHGALKDVSSQSDANQVIQGTKKYDAFGNTIGGSGFWYGNSGYGGKHGYQTDGGLQLLGHRYYDSETGTFITRDPIKDGRNWYSYCDNNPVNAIDANGLEWDIVVYGDNHDVPFAYTGFYLSRPVVHLVHGDKEYNEPTKKELIEAMIECEGDFFFYGHGAPDGSIVINSKGERINKADLSYIAKEKKRRGKRKMKSVTLKACNIANKGENINSWLQIAGEVTAYCGLTATATWPPRFGTPKTYKAPVTFDKNPQGRAEDKIGPRNGKGSF